LMAALAAPTIAPREPLAEEDWLLLEPDTWSGKPFWLADHIDIGDRLKQGEWLVVLYHHDCSVCARAIRDLEQRARGGQRGQVALIEVPPLQAQPDLPRAGFVYGRLDSDGPQWFVTTPVMIHLTEGVVTRTGGVAP
jgi:hypothetical protein